MKKGIYILISLIIIVSILCLLKENKKIFDFKTTQIAIISAIKK